MDKFGSSCSFRNNKVNLYQNSNVVGFALLIDNLYMLDLRIQKLVSDEILEPLELSNFEVCVECIKRKRRDIRKLGVKRAKNVLELIHIDICDDYSRYSYLYLIHEKSQSLDIFKSFKAKLNFNLERKLKPSYLIMMVNIMRVWNCFAIHHLTRPIMNFGPAKSQTSNTCTFGVVQLKHDLIGRTKENWIQEQLVILDFLRNLSLRKKKENIMNVVFEGKFVNYICQVLVSITIQETTLVIEDNFQTIIPNIVPK
ncbi:hypothetical protein CR513_53299, partial [Mucuna pruriens]